VAAMGYPSVGPIYTSTDSGITWFSNNIVADWSSVASSADGDKLLAVSFNDGNGGNGAVWTSTNAGGSWISNNIPYFPPANFRSFQSAASSADGTILVVGTYGNLIYSSTNSGLNWKSNNVPSATWQSVASSADGTKLVATVYLGAIYTSTNSGATWKTNNAPKNSWRSVASSADGYKLVAVGFNIYTSTNSGATWVSNNVPGTWRYSVSSSADGNLLATVNTTGGGIYTSYATPTPQLELTTTINNLAFSWLVPSTNFVLQQSSDLISWSTVTDSPTLNLTNLQNQVSLTPSNEFDFFRLSTP